MSLVYRDLFRIQEIRGAARTPKLRRKHSRQTFVGACVSSRSEQPSIESLKDRGPQDDVAIVARTPAMLFEFMTMGRRTQRMAIEPARCIWADEVADEIVHRYHLYRRSQEVVRDAKFRQPRRYTYVVGTPKRVWLICPLCVRKTLLGDF